MVIVLRDAIDSQIGRFFIISQLCLALDVVYFYFWSEKPYILFLFPFKLLDLFFPCVSPFR